EVLDDPVEDDVDAVLVVVVRVRICLGDAPVGGPARVADACGRMRLDGGNTAARAGLLGDCVLEELEVAHRANGLDPAVPEQGQARGVVAAVFEALETCEEELPTRTLAHVSNDSAHCRSSFLENARSRFGAAPQDPLRG